MESLLKCKHESPDYGLGLEYLRLFGFPTLLWVMGSALLAALPFWRQGELKLLAGALGLTAIATALAFLLSKYAQLSQVMVLSASLAFSLASIGLIKFGLVETQFLLLLNYSLILLCLTSVIVALLRYLNALTATILTE